MGWPVRKAARPFTPQVAHHAPAIMHAGQRIGFHQQAAEMVLHPAGLTRIGVDGGR